MYGWAPLAIMGEEINKLSASASSPASYPGSAENSAVEMSLLSDDPLSRPEEPLSHTYKNQHSDPDADEDGMAGIYLGIHNIFATIPQFLATFVSMIVFHILEPGQSPELANGEAPSSPAAAAEDNGEKTPGGWASSGISGTAVCLAIGAVFQLAAAAQSFRMRRS